MMEYRAAGDGDLPFLKGLWLASFDDGPDFVDMFFAAHPAGSVLVAAEEGVPVSMLTVMPLELETGSAPEKAAYIFAVATDPGQRGKGLSTGLLEYAKCVLRKRGFSVALLVPGGKSLRAFYAARGFLPLPPVGEAEFAASELRPGGAKLVPADGDDYAALRDDAFSAPGYFRWSAGEVDFSVRDAEASGGGAFYFSCEEAEGGVLCYFEDGVLSVGELAMAQPDEKTVKSALGQLTASFGADRAVLRMKAGALPWLTERDFAMYCPLREGFSLPEGAYFGLALD